MSMLFLLISQSAWADTDPCMSAPNIFTRRYVMFGCNLRTKSESDRTKRFALLNRVHKSGYNAIIHYNDFMVMGRNSRTWFDNFRGLSAEAKRLGLAQGMYDAGQKHPSFHDRNVAEGFPVRGTRFIAKGGKGQLLSDHTITLKNKGFEEFTGNGHAPKDWKLYSLGPGSTCFADHVNKRSGAASVRLENPAYPAALMQYIQVKPYRAYRISLWIKTKNFTQAGWTAPCVMGGSNMWLLRITHPHPFGWGQYAVGQNQNWKKSVIDFNSLHNSRITLYLYPISYSAPGTGTIWFDDVQIEEVGLYEAVKRESAPVQVTAESSGKAFQEGTDFTLDIKADFNHQGRMFIPENSAISEGDTLRVGWHQFANVDEFRTPDAVGCVPEYYQYLEKDIRAIHEVLNPLQIVFVQHGEWRTGFWDPTCIAQYKSAGAYMAAVAQKTRSVYRKVYPDMEVGFKNDMWDPFHNQLANPYYTTNGSMKGNDIGITQDMTMLNWIPATSSDSGSLFWNSTLFWGGMHPKYPRKPLRQMFRMHGDAGIPDVQYRLDGLKKMEAKGLRGVTGALYNTWSLNFTTLEKAAELCKQAGRWATNSYTPETCQQAYYNPAVKETPDFGPSSLKASVVQKGNRAVLSYALPRNSVVKWRIHNMAGQVLRSSPLGNREAGKHSVSLNTRSMTAGIYLISLSVENDLNSSQKTAVFSKLAVLE